MRIIFLNRFFYPDISATSQILSDLAFHLADRHDVHVITSRLRYDRRDVRLPAAERIRNVSVHRVWTTRGAQSLASRALSYFTFYVFASVKALQLATRGDVVVAMTDPPMISVPAAAVTKLTGSRLVNWVHDIFPEIAGELDFKRVPGVLRRWLAWLRDGSLAAAVCNVALGELMAQTIAARGIAAQKIRIIHNWASGEQIVPLAPEKNPLRLQWGLQGKFVVGYSGNMGRAHDFDALLAAAGLLRARSRIVFLLIGGGKQRPAIEEKIQTDQLTNVMLQPYQPREILSQSLTVPDCHIVSLKPALEGLIVPSKIYSTLAAGRPVIFLGAPDGEIGRLVTAIQPTFGVTVAPDDVHGLVQTIEDFCDDPEAAASCGRSGRKLFERQFDQPIALAEWTELFAELGGAR